MVRLIFRGGADLDTGDQQHSMIRFLLFFLPAAIALAQESGAALAPLSVPLLGYLASGSPVTVRPIAGAPGAVVLGGAIPLPDHITRVIPAPGQPFALVETAGAAQSGIVILSLAGAGNVLAIPNTFPHSDRVAFSPSGSVAVLYSAATQQAQVVSGLPASPQLSRTVDLSPSGLPLVSIAVSDDAQAILAGVSDGTSGAVWTFVAGESAQQATSAGVPSALRFFSSKQDAIVADRGWQQVLLLPSGAAPRLLAGAIQGIRCPADVEISTDQQTVWVADTNAADSTALGRRGDVQATGPATGRLFSINIASGSVAIAPSSVDAASLTRLAGDSVFLLASHDGSSAGLFSSANTAVWRLKGAGSE